MRLTTKSAALAWLCSYNTLIWASTSFAQDIHNYDWMSLLLAAAAGLLGGAGRTILTLVSPRALVGNVPVLLLKDLVVALVGGAVVYMIIQGYNSWAGSLTYFNLPPITRDFRVLLIVLAGGSRGRWLGVVDRFATDAIANARKKLGAGIAADLPSVAAAPEPPGQGAAN